MADPAGSRTPSGIRDVVRSRRSTRAFLPRSVSEATIREIIADALWAPSWANTQPWEIFVVTGEPLERFKQENREALLSGRTSPPEIPIPVDWPDVLKSRRVDLAKSIFEAISVGREDSEGRLRHYADMYHLFDAPALVLFVIDKALRLEYTMLDVGVFLQTFFLLAYDRGLGACAFAGTVHSPEVVHKELAIPETKLLVIGAALGWPDPEAPINNFPRTRGRLEEFVTWIG